MDELLAAHHSHVLAACVDDPALLAACGGRIPFLANSGLIALDDQLSSAELIYTTSQEDFGVAAPLCAARGATLIDASHVHEAEFLQAWQRHSPTPELTRLDLTGIGSWFDEAPEQRLRFAALLVATRKLLLPLAVEPSLRRFSPTELPVLLLADPSQLRERAQAVVRGGSPLARASVGSPRGKARSRRSC